MTLTIEVILEGLPTRCGYQSYFPTTRVLKWNLQMNSCKTLSPVDVIRAGLGEWDGARYSLRQNMCVCVCVHACVCVQGDELHLA